VHTSRTTDILLRKVAWNKLKSLAFILAAKYQTLEKKKKLLGIQRTPGPNIRRPKTVARGKGKVAASNLLAEDEREKPQVTLSNIGTNAEVGQTINLEDIVAVAQSQLEMGRKCGKNVPAKISSGNGSVGRKNRQKEN
jgi:hypothetical protein